MRKAVLREHAPLLVLIRTKSIDKYLRASQLGRLKAGPRLRYMVEVKTSFLAR